MFLFLFVSSFFSFVRVCDGFDNATINFSYLHLMGVWMFYLLRSVWKSQHNSESFSHRCVQFSDLLNIFRIDLDFSNQKTRGNKRATVGRDNRFSVLEGKAIYTLPFAIFFLWEWYNLNLSSWYSVLYLFWTLSTLCWIHWEILAYSQILFAEFVLDLVSLSVVRSSFPSLCSWSLAVFFFLCIQMKFLSTAKFHHGL